MVGNSIAPRAGAWIETVRVGRQFVTSRIAPRAGAGIETSSSTQFPMSAAIAPRAGAWIETGSGTPPTTKSSSPLARGHGVKPGLDGPHLIGGDRPSRGGVD